MIPLLLQRILDYEYPSNWMTKGEQLLVNLEVAVALNSITASTPSTALAQKVGFASITRTLYA